MEPIDGVIDRLDAALRGAGLEGLAVRTEAAALDEIAQTIAPWSLPEDLRRFWERASFASLRAHGFAMPQPLDPRAALETYGSRPPAGDMGYIPPLLFPIASEGSARWLIELGTSSTSGGVVFAYGGSELYAEYPTFSDLLEVLAELLEESHFTPEGTGSVRLVREHEHPRQQARFDAHADPRFAGTRHMWLNPEDWPAHWLASAGFDSPDHQPIGATHTIAEVIEASRDGPIRARIAGRVTRVASMGEDAGVVVDDGTGTLAVWCPGGTSPWTLVIRRRYEFEVQVPRAVGDGSNSSVATDIRYLDEHGADL
jgi:hypothetical protein